MSVGLGNVWRFPNAAYANGGGAFLIPYLIVLLVIGRPLYYMELVFAQFSGLGPAKIWKAVPAMKGLGFAQTVSNAYMSIFYNYIIAISVRYIVASMSPTLPWTECQDDWFQGRYSHLSCDSFNVSSFPSNLTAGLRGNNVTERTGVVSVTRRVSVPELYWKYRIARQSAGLWEINWLSWELALCLLFVWAFIAVSVSKGIKSVGKVVYFTTAFPYIVLISLLVVASLEEGAVDGIKHFFTPEWHKLLDIQVWYKACEQSFFSLGVGYGYILMYSSYNDFKHNIYRDAILLSFLDTFTSILAGTVVFAVLGSLAVKLGVSFSDVIGSSGTDLVFIVYPEALSRIKFLPQLWSVLFFIMLFTLGIGTSVAFVETVFTVIRDQFPQLRKRKWVLVLPGAVFLYLCGLCLATDAGQYVMMLLDNYGVGTATFLYAILETAAIMWIYGLRNFCADVEFMLGRSVGIFWKVTWSFTAPVLLSVIFIYGNVLLFMAGGGYGKGIPWWGNLIGWMLTVVCLVQLPLWMFVVYRKAEGNTLLEKLQTSFRPTLDWGPRDPDRRKQWRAFKAEHNVMQKSPPYAVFVLPATAGRSNPAFEHHDDNASF